MNEELERIVHNTDESVAFSALTSEEARAWIRTRLQSFRIYSAGQDNDQNMSTAIRVFECEYIECVPERLTGMLDSVVVQAMNSAFNDNWQRELSFFLVRENQNVYFPFDKDNQAAFGQLRGNEIFAQERGSEDRFLLGTAVHFLGRYGMARFARDHLHNISSTANSIQKVIYVVARNEGGVSGSDGGYDTVNSFDRVVLSVGLFHWNGLWLANLLNEYRIVSDTSYNTLMERLGFTSLVGTMLTIGDRPAFNLNTEDESILNVLRRLRYVYHFLREATEPGFRQAQRQLANNWVRTILNAQRLVPGDNNSLRLRDYINSELAVALYIDMTVHRGRQRGLDRVRDAITSVINRPDPPPANPAQWNATHEGWLIEAIKQQRRVGETGNTLANINARIERIENDTSLSRARITDANAQNAAWGEFI